jgi:hypothetical protein
MSSARGEVDHPLLGDPENSVQTASDEGRQVSERPERSIPDEDVARHHRRVQLGDERRLMRPKRGDDHPEEKAGAGVEQGEDPGDGESTTVGLVGGLSGARATNSS